MMWGWGMGLNGLWMLGGLILSIAIVVIVVAIVVALTGPGARRSEAGSREPIDILRDRLARGEINEAEFEQAKRTLGYDR